MESINQNNDERKKNLETIRTALLKGLDKANEEDRSFITKELDGIEAKLSKLRNK